jgi:hypothetical protein
MLLQLPMFKFSEKPIAFRAKQQSSNLALSNSSYERRREKVPKKDEKG